MGIYKSAYSGRQVDDAVARTSALNYDSTNKVLTVNGESDLQITQMGTDDKSVATKKYVDDHAPNVHIENGTGSNSIQQTQDGTTGTFDFTNKNAIATSLDPTLTGQIAYGGVGAYSSVTGGKAQASGKRSSAEGTTTIAKGNYSHAEGDNSVALGSDSHAEGYETTTNGMAAHSEGFKTLANAHSSHSEGFETKTFGDSSHAEGAYSQTLKQYVVAKSGTTSPDVEQPTFDLMATNLSENCGYAAHAEGSSKALGYLAHSQGSSNAYGHYSFASGIGCQTGSLELSQETATEKIYKSNEVGRGAHAFGVGAYAQYNAQTAVGMFNDNKTDSLFEVGNGESHGHRSNAFAVYQDGHAEIMTVGNSDTSVVTKGYVDAHAGDTQIPEKLTLAFNLVTNQYQSTIPGGVKFGTEEEDPSGYIRRQLQNAQGTPITDDSSIESYMYFMTGVKAIPTYDSLTNQTCFLFLTSTNTCWKLQKESTGLWAYKVNNFPFATKAYVDEAVASEGEPAPDAEGEYVRACKVVAHKETETVRDGSVASTHAFSFLVEDFDENCLSAHINITTSTAPLRQVCSVDIVFSGMSGECTGSTVTGGALSGTYTIDGANYCLVTLDNAVLSSSNAVKGSIVRLTGDFDKQYYWKKVD